MIILIGCVVVVLFSVLSMSANEHYDINMPVVDNRPGYKRYGGFSE